MLLGTDCGFTVPTIAVRQFLAPRPLAPPAGMPTSCACGSEGPGEVFADDFPGSGTLLPLYLSHTGH